MQRVLNIMKTGLTQSAQVRRAKTSQGKRTKKSAGVSNSAHKNEQDSETLKRTKRTVKTNKKARLQSDRTVSNPEGRDPDPPNLPGPSKINPGSRSKLKRSTYFKGKGKFARADNSKRVVKKLIALTNVVHESPSHYCSESDSS